VQRFFLSLYCLISFVIPLLMVNKVDQLIMEPPLFRWLTVTVVDCRVVYVTTAGPCAA